MTLRGKHSVSVTNILCTYLGMVLCGWALTDAAATPRACAAVFSSLSNILFIPPSKKYSWQTLEARHISLKHRQILLSKSHKSTSKKLSWVHPHCRHVHNQSTVPAAPLDAPLSFAVFCPVVVSKILHGEGIFTQSLLILTVLPPDLIKVTHCKIDIKSGEINNPRHLLSHITCSCTPVQYSVFIW